ncbi:hypothetical protein GS399_05100 [Pedobacter sp. HMF7647]|uniref:DUF4325 domain-containing protein n=1 Tax=Hufsiella arboris TaxID=2695275 RepID=A0A7K1Y7G0_9SPHI|nr:DUF4325 domain-containing protein [Hufsiella arboris]MXV50341.1 hypothetical protein [Hufsiella arboris]
MTSEIKIVSFLPATLDTRESASRLTNLIKEELGTSKKIELDFQSVLFMSRSFADQFHKEVSRLENIDLVINNADFGIVEMLNSVAKTQTQRNPVNTNYKVLSFDNLSKLTDFSYAW